MDAALKWMRSQVAIKESQTKIASNILIKYFLYFCDRRPVKILKNNQETTAISKELLKSQNFPANWNHMPISKAGVRKTKNIVNSLNKLSQNLVSRDRMTFFSYRCWRQRGKREVVECLAPKCDFFFSASYFPSKRKTSTIFQAQ